MPLTTYLPVVTYPRARQKSAGTGIGDFVVTLAGGDNVVGFQEITAAAPTNERVYYCITHRTEANQWEEGVGYLKTTSGTRYFVRERMIKNSEGTTDFIDFAAGTKDITFTVPSSLCGNLQQVGHNYLINGGFEHFQRQDPGTATSRADGAFGPDRTYMLTQLGNVSCIRNTGGPGGSPWMLGIIQANATSQRFGASQIVEHAATYALRGRKVIFQGVASRSSGSGTMGAALIAWTGTANAPTRDWMATWASTSYTAGSFFAGTDVTVINVSQTSINSSGYQEFEVRGLVPTDANNLAVVVWAIEPVAQNVVLRTTDWGLFEGEERRLWLPRPGRAELDLCLPYCQVVGPSSMNGFRSLTLNMLFFLAFAAEFRKSPTFSHNVTAYTPGFSPGATEFSAFNITDSANVTISGALSLSADSWTGNRLRLVASAGTSFSGSGGNVVSGSLGSGVRFVFDSEI